MKKRFGLIGRTAALLCCCLLLSGCAGTGARSEVSSDPQTVISVPAASILSLSESTAMSKFTASVPEASSAVSSAPVSSAPKTSSATVSSRASRAAASSEAPAASVTASPQTSSETETSVPSEPEPSSEASVISAAASSESEPQPPEETESELRGVWISYYELEDLRDYEAYCERIGKMFDKVADLGLNAVFFHVRPMSDALYPSELFPFSHVIGFKENGKAVQGVDPGYDPLAVAVAAAHERGLQLHAWVNPYRVWNNGSDPDALSAKNPAYRWTHDNDPDNDDWVRVWDGKLYYDPGAAEVRELITAGVLEIVRNYDVDGIHFDDYFYPTTDAAFDASTFAGYQAAGGTLSLEDWRRENVNLLVRTVYREIKALRDIPFGISPGGKIKADREECFADVSLWAHEEGYVDYLCPQIYFGFLHQKYPFEQTLEDWLELRGESSVPMYVGLPVYKLGAKDAYAGSVRGMEEFLHADGTLIARMVRMLREKGADGFILFSYGDVTSVKNAAEMAELAKELR